MCARVWLRVSCRLWPGQARLTDLWATCTLQRYLTVQCYHATLPCNACTATRWGECLFQIEIISPLPSCLQTVGSLLTANAMILTSCPYDPITVGSLPTANASILTPCPYDPITVGSLLTANAMILTPCPYDPITVGSLLTANAARPVNHNF